MSESPSECHHYVKVRHGHDRKGLQRSRCKACGATFTEESTPDHRLEQLMPLYRSGISIREASGIASISKGTVGRIYALLRERLGPSLCGCGKQSGHKGWCETRVIKSESRQCYYRSESTKKFIRDTAVRNSRGITQLDREYPDPTVGLRLNKNRFLYSSEVPY